ncbi:MAG: phospholipase [Syntrophaceae bacterium]|nr:phospholipase [Syntrophaceae bacterium]
MHGFSLFRKLVFLGLLIGMIFSSPLFAAQKRVASSRDTGCSVVLLKNQEYFSALTAAIDEAKSEIIMSFFLFKAGVHKNSLPDRILSRLVQAARKGVKVIVILEKSGGNDRNLDAENNRTKQFLEEKGIKVYFDSPQKTTHTKLVVIDQRLVLLGSHNLTQSALKYNNEMSLLIDRPDLAKEARTYMLEIIKEAK